MTPFAARRLGHGLLMRMSTQLPQAWHR